jgi:hypothetical protein
MVYVRPKHIRVPENTKILNKAVQTYYLHHKFMIAITKQDTLN